MKQKIAFFDIDGTLCDSQGEVLASSVTAIQGFRKKGNLAYLCTGRSKPEIIDSIVAIGFDGVIGAGGGYVVMNEDVVIHETMPKDAVREIVSYFDSQDIGYYLESNDGLFSSDNCIPNIKKAISASANTTEEYQALEQQIVWFYDLISPIDPEKIDYGNVNKISFINTTVAFEEITNKYRDAFHIYHSTVPLFGPLSGEIAVKGIDKERAVKYVLNALSMEPEQAIAYGDGNNDIAMFNAVGHSVAMANGTDELKAVATEITEDADHDGIYLNMLKHGWC